MTEQPWYVHVLGPDDIEGPFDTMEHALRHAAQINSWLAERDDPITQFTPMLWAVPTQSEWGTTNYQPAVPSVQPPTREQIAEALYRAKYPFANLAFAHESGIERRRIFDQADAVLALFLHPEPSVHHDDCASHISGMGIPGLEGVPQPCNCHLFAPPQSEVAIDLLARMWQAYADKQCGWQDAASYHGHSQCNKDGREAAGRVFEEVIPQLQDMLPAPTADHFQSKQEALLAEPVSIADMAPGTTFRARHVQGTGLDDREVLWTVEGASGPYGPLVESETGTWRYTTVEPSTIRDVTPPAATPEEGER